MTNLDLTKTVSIRIRRDTSSNWSLKNPVLKIGEPGLETDTRKLKFGDGTTAWNNLPYIGIDVLQLSGNYATLVNGKVPPSQLPSYVDDVIEAANLATLPVSGETGKIYVTLDSNKVYRWSGSTYVEISASTGSTDSVPEGSVNKYYTDARASAAAPVQSVAGKTGTVTLAKSDVGLDNVDNTSDADKPISSATQTALNDKAATSHTHDDRYYTESEIDTFLAGKQASGSYATLTEGKIPSSQLPSYVDDVIEAANLATLPVSGETGKIYVTLDSNKVYRWSGSTYVEISASPGSTDSVPEGGVNKYYTDARASAAAPVQSVAGKTGIVSLGKSDVGLNNVDNTSDANKPVSTATQSALDAKAPIASPTFTGTVSGISKSMVGLGNVDNTSDADKPISSATQTALNGKAATSHTHDDRYYIESEIDTFLATKLDASKTNLLGSRTLYVDGSRTDTYTADGTILRPFKTIQAAHDFAVTAFPVPVSAAWYTQQVVIRINAGWHVENLTVTRPNTHFVGAGGAKTRDVIIRGTVTLDITSNPAGPAEYDNNLVSFSNLIIASDLGLATLFTAGGTAPYQLFFAHVHLSNGSGYAGSTAGKTFEVTNTSTEGIKVEIREMLVGQDYNSLVAMTFNNTRVADIDQLSATSLGTVVELNTTFANITNSKFETSGTSDGVAVIRAISSFSGAPATLVIGNTIILNRGTNSDGIYIGAGAVAQVGQVAFNVGTVLGTGFAVNGVTGATLISGSNLFGVLPVSPFLTNNKVATAITNASLSTSLTRNNVALDTRTPSSHTHGNITNAGAIGSTANLPIITGTSGVLQAGSFGTSANTFCQGNDSRLSDARTPTSHTHVKSDVGLGNVDNTSDANKPVSTATQTALDAKAPIASPTFTGTVSGISKSMVGLGNVDNTSDANKPISTATQTALDLKINSTEVDTDLAGGPGISLLYDNSNDLLSIYANNENYITAFSGFSSGSTPINYDATTSSIQTLTLNGIAVTFTKGTGWPTSSNVSVDTILRITVTSATSITWSIVNDWFNQPPAGALSIGTHLFLLRAIGSSIIEGHYIGNKTN